MDAKRFCVSVHSDDCCDIYPGNTATSFRNYLSQDISVPEDTYEVGLAQLHYNLSNTVKPKVNPSLNAVISVPQPRKFFKGDFEQYTVFKLNKSNISIKKPSEGNNISYLTTLVTSKFTEKGLSLNITELLKEGESEPHSVLRWKDDEKNRTLYLPSELLSILGFDTDSFNPGIYESRNTRRPDQYSLIDQDKIFEFVLYSWDKISGKIAEPTKYTTESLFLSIAQSVKNSGFKIGVLHHASKNTAQIKIFETGIQLQLSPSLNELLGLATGFTFSLPSTTVFLPNDLVALNALNQPIVQPASEAIQWEERSDLLLHTNLISEQRVGSKSYPTIRIVHEYSTKAPRTVIFDPVIYLPLKLSDVKTVHVWLSDHRNNLLVPAAYPTSVVLYFKPMRV